MDAGTAGTERIARPDRPDRGDAGSARSHSEIIRLALLDDLENGRLLPGQVMDEKELAERFGVSRTPVREALLGLAAQQLVQFAPRSSIRVYSPEASELVSMLEALAELEASVVRLCTLRMDQGECEEIKRHADATTVAAANSDSAAYDAANEKFHAALYAGCRNQVLIDQIRQLRRRLGAYRRKAHNLPNRLKPGALDHQQIVEALFLDDPEKGGQAMREHVLVKGRAFADLLLATPAALSSR